ncbi:MAG: TCP-1/cpn60 chaperonin family protein [Halobacterium sp.]
MEPSPITASDDPLDDVDVLDGAVQLGELAAGLYGPDGRHKLVVAGDGPVVAGDLQQLFEAIDVEHPGAVMVGNGAVQHKETVGDGSTAVVLLARALAERADDLLADGMHRASVADGFDRARAAAVGAVPSISTPVDGLDDPRGRAAVRAALGGYDDVDQALDAVTDAARLVADARQTGREGVGVDHVAFEHVSDAHAPTVELLRGFFLDREPVTPNTPREFEDARVAVVGGAKKSGQGIEERELKRAGGSEGKGRTEVTVNPETPDDRTAFRAREAEEVAAQVQVLADAGVDVVFTAMGISDAAISALDDADITAFRGLQAPQARRVARATGAALVMDLADITPADVGTAGRLRVEGDGEDSRVRIDRCEDSEVATLLVSGTVRAGVESMQRDLMTAIVTGRRILEGGAVVPGGGGAWTRLAAAVREDARSVSDRSAVVMDAFADALEDVPRTLARNAGGDEVDALTALRAGPPDAVFDTDARDVRPAGERGPYDLAAVVEGAVATASDVVAQLVRIDDVVRAADDSGDEPTDYDFQPDPERDLA